jgi:hypothetical protein
MLQPMGVATQGGEELSKPVEDDTCCVRLGAVGYLRLFVENIAL